MKGATVLRVKEDEGFVEKVVCFDEAQFKFNGTVNQHNSVYWYANNSYVSVKKAFNLPGI